MTLGDFFYSIVKTPIRWYFALKFNARENINEAKSYDGPLLLIGPHVALEDSLFAVIYRGTLVRFIASDANWDLGFRNAAFKLFQVIPFKRQRLDVKAIRKLKKSVSEGHSVGLFPEGARTWDGQSLRIIPSIAKLVKLLRVPVYTITYDGLYLTRPRWAGKNTRRGRIDVNIREVITKQQLKAANNDELLKLIENAIKSNEFDWQRKAMVKFKGKNYAEHIERLLYRCPKCDAVNSLKSSGDHFTCTSCEATYTVNPYGFIEGCSQFDNTADWNDWQRSQLDNILNSNFKYEQSDIQLERIGESKRYTDRVKMTLTANAIEIVFENDEQLTLPLQNVRSCDAIFSDCVEFYVNDIKHRFLFEPEKNHMSLKLFEDVVLAQSAKLKQA